MMRTTLYLGELWHTPTAPRPGGLGEDGLVSHPQGALAVAEDGTIIELGTASELRPRYPQGAVVDFGDSVLMPGFVDAHVHFPQLDMIGAHGEQLLGWLTAHTYPEEQRYADAAVAREAAGRFCAELLAEGTTLAAVYGSVHRAATESLFSAAEVSGLRAIIGKASMDRAAPAALLQDAASDLRDNEELIQTWHGRAGRLFVALTPRFALSCTPALLSGLGALRAKYPGIYVQSHHAETRAEVAAVRAEFPKAPHYLGVYHQHGLLGERTILGHGIYAEEAELDLYASTRTVVAHCPSSNLFLGSGLFPMRRFMEAGVRTALGSDVGAGTSLALLATMGDAYKVQALLGSSVAPAYLLYLATLAGAEALGLEGTCGSFAAGKQADFQVLDWRRSALLAARFGRQTRASERLLPLCFLGNSELRTAVYIGGRCVYRKEAR